MFVKPTTIRFIGDLHGNLHLYMHFLQGQEQTIQVGDLGFDYKPLEQVDPDTHKCLGGNHDNYAHMRSDHWLGDFGTYYPKAFCPIFYVRGASSIDNATRLIGINRHDEEQLNAQQRFDALEAYKLAKPKFVLSHDCPMSICEFAFGKKQWDNLEVKPSFTAQLLQAMLEYHVPKYWVFGHHHRQWSANFMGSQFECAPMDGYIDIEYDQETDTCKTIGRAGIQPYRF